MLMRAVLWMIGSSAAFLGAPMAVRKSRLPAGRMPPPVSTDADAEMRKVLLEVSDQLASADDRGAIQTLTSRVGELLSCDLLSLTSEVDSATRELVMSFVEEFSAQAKEFEGRRERLLLEIVDAVKSTPPNALDGKLADFRADIVSTGLLDLVDAEIAKLEESGQVVDFMVALRDRIRLEVARAVYGDDAVALNNILSAPTDSERSALLLNELRARRTSDQRDSLLQLVRETRDELTDGDESIRITLENLLDVAQGDVVVSEDDDNFINT